MTIMDDIYLPTIPDNYHLEKGFLSSFDLDENLLNELIDQKDINKYLFIRGDGEYIPIDDINNPIKERIVNIFFDLTDKKLINNKYQPVKYHHAKIWLFIYVNDDGDKISKLIIQSKNIYRYNSKEIAVNFIGKLTKEKHDKNNSLIDYFKSLLPFLNDDKKEFIDSLLNELPYYSYELENDDFICDDYEIITPICYKMPLFDDGYDEILIIAPFINVDTINTLLEQKKPNGRCVVISQAKINESLIISDVSGVQFISPSIIDKFIHAKIYLLRNNNHWDLYIGSMNLSDYSIYKNIEAMVHLKDVKNIKSIESFINDFIGKDISDELKQYSLEYGDKSISPVFNRAFDIKTRIQYIKRLLINKQYDEQYMNQVSSYLLSYQCVIDLNDLATFKREIIPHRQLVITNKIKKRYVYRLPFMENTLLGLLNYSLHQYDYLFSKNVYLHILDRSVDNAFIKLHQLEDLKDLYIFKTDIHSFDPSMNKEVLCSQIDKLLHFDNHLCQFLKSIVNESRYYLERDHKIHTDDIIHQTGLPLGGFLENVYLYDFDYIYDKAPLYMRCGDDILIGSKDINEVKEYQESVIALLNDEKLSISENKTSISSPGENVSYLGWEIINGEIDFPDSVIKKVEKTIKKKTKELLIMYGKKKIPNALRLISILKYVKHYQKSEFFINSFKRITITDGLKKIDKMMMDLIRTVVSGKTGNAKYKVKYLTIQAFGYKSLVYQYYEYISVK